ncbi:uncharacterized protein C8Q71DRAFT_728331 [Rhodofomes roseus]|uniref:Uncharacterized protein n=1 Tax=Rhodofomes roseus TaxID=34475 RepID=A0ABQ8JY78_9APHY|nr:uncharacterized protein C8Q71DRAFT_728331 [Rhodofomes roseus]KAH9829008.1 hypothetical protein C8Q71DRAFT_728331 [Rhodofomes roseus]
MCSMFSPALLQALLAAPSHVAPLTAPLAPPSRLMAAPPPPAPMHPSAAPLAPSPFADTSQCIPSSAASASAHQRSAPRPAAGPSMPAQLSAHPIDRAPVLTRTMASLYIRKKYTTGHVQDGRSVTSQHTSEQWPSGGSRCQLARARHVGSCSPSSSSRHPCVGTWSAGCCASGARGHAKRGRPSWYLPGKIAQMRITGAGCSVRHLSMPVVTEMQGERDEWVVLHGQASVAAHCACVSEARPTTANDDTVGMRSYAGCVPSLAFMLAIAYGARPVSCCCQVVMPHDVRDKPQRTHFVQVKAVDARELVRNPRSRHVEEDEDAKYSATHRYISPEYQKEGLGNGTGGQDRGWSLMGAYSDQVDS